MTRKRLINRWLYGSVAVVLLFLAVGLMFLHSSSRPDVPVAGSMQITPLRGVAELVLATGERIPLDSLHAGRLVRQPGGLVAIDTTAHLLSYLRDSSSVAFDSFSYNEIRIPKGGEYTLLLADGSRVWLNAESILRYPVRFAGSRREVFLEGEACFEVKRDEQCPFVVRTGCRSVEVLGTVFNVCAYSPDSYWHTTLLSGKVRVSGSRDTCLLSPSEQYVENTATGEGEIRRVDAAQYLSWRTGKVSFRGERLEDIIRKLERWYDFEMFYANDEVRGMRFRGVINKYDSFDTVLRKLERTTNIRFDIKGKTVIAGKSYQE